MTDATRATRRSSATVRSLVLAAARELFDRCAYEDVSTREIAERAGVTQAAVFRHFGTKSELFVEAVCQPLYGFITEYLRRWVDGGHGSDTSLHDTEVFVDGLYRLLLDNRGLLAALAGNAPEGVRPDLLQNVFDRLAREVAVETRAQHNDTMDPAYAVRFAFALIYGMAMLDDTLFPTDGRPDGRAIVQQLAAYVLRGSLIR